MQPKLGLLIALGIWLAACTAVAPAPPTMVPTFTPLPIFKGWASRIDEAQAKWEASGIRSYTLSGRASWAWHTHTFEIEVRDGQVVEASCEVEYEPNFPDWCSKHFDAAAHTVPRLLERAREMLQWGEENAPGDNCLQAEFGSQGVPTRIDFDCPKAEEDAEGWVIRFTPTEP